MSIILLYDTLQPTPPLVDTVINEPLRQRAPLQHNRLPELIFNSGILIITGIHSQKMLLTIILLNTNKTRRLYRGILFHYCVHEKVVLRVSKTRDTTGEKILACLVPSDK